MPEILGISDAPCVSGNDPEGWHVQVFRSIDSNSVKNFPKDPKDGTKKNLLCRKNVLIDMSIHSAYVKEMPKDLYETIYKALVEVGLEDAYSPQDFLNFYCLGNREALDANYQPDSQPVANNPQGLSKKNRRFMIYVHSKGMIVDDEYVILRSVNINQRSMEGTRDTEIL